MSIYRELDPMPKHRTKKRNLAKINKPNLIYLNQHINTEITNDSRDHAIVPDTVKTMFNLDIESADKILAIVKMQVHN